MLSVFIDNIQHEYMPRDDLQMISPSPHACMGSPRPDSTQSREDRCRITKPEQRGLDAKHPYSIWMRSMLTASQISLTRDSRGIVSRDSLETLIRALRLHAGLVSDHTVFIHSRDGRTRKCEIREALDGIVRPETVAG